MKSSGAKDVDYCWTEEMVVEWYLGGHPVVVRRLGLRAKESQMSGEKDASVIGAAYCCLQMLLLFALMT